jgi:hypothetical protein
VGIAISRSDPALNSSPKWERPNRKIRVNPGK